MKFAGGPRCTVEPFSVLGEAGNKSVYSIRVGFGPKGGIAAWPEDQKALRIVPLSAHGATTGSGSTVAIAASSPVVMVEPVADAFVVGTEGRCRELGDGWSSKCVHYVGVDGSGMPLGAPREFLSHEPLRSSVHATRDGGEPLFLWSYLYVRNQIVSFSLTPDRAVQAHELLERPWRQRGNTDPWVFGRAITTHGARWFAVFENRLRGSYLLDDTGAKRPLKWIRDFEPTQAIWGAGPWKLRWDGDALALLYEERFDSGKGVWRYARFSRDGALLGKVQKVSADMAAPAPFADDLVYSLSPEENWKLALVRSNAVGRSIGEPTPIGAVGGSTDWLEHPYDVAWTGDGFVVVYKVAQEAGIQIRSARIVCDAGDD